MIKFAVLSLAVAAALALSAGTAFAHEHGSCRAWGQGDVAALAQTGDLGALVRELAPVNGDVAEEHAATCEAR
ncbi:MAG: hypothetical protein HYX53_17825 [Chloroflexi bacterium]|nr:hypothetical protein [Chloroflexota bacterium]